MPWSTCISSAWATRKSWPSWLCATVWCATACCGSATIFRWLIWKPLLATLIRTSAEVLINVASSGFQISHRKIVAEPQHAVAHHTVAHNHDGQDFLVAQALEIHVLQGIVLAGARRNGHAHSVRDKRQHMRSALHELLHILKALQVSLDQDLISGGQAGLSG